MAADLKKAGLNRVNFSMDTMVEERFQFITRRSGLDKVRAAIFKALELNMHPVKINTVIIRGFNNDDEVMDFAELA
jgi:cyclic pyranopterin phosphate synthase